MNPRLIAQLIAAGRVVIGTTLLVKPEAITTHWVGSGDASTRIMASGLGIRDVVIGGGVLTALRGGDARPWLAGSALADLGDLLSTVRNRDELSQASLLGTVAMAGGAAAVGFWLAGQDELA